MRGLPGTESDAGCKCKRPAPSPRPSPPMGEREPECRARSSAASASDPFSPLGEKAGMRGLRRKRTDPAHALPCVTVLQAPQRGRSQFIFSLRCRAKGAASTLPGNSPTYESNFEKAHRLRLYHRLDGERHRHYQHAACLGPGARQQRDRLRVCQRPLDGGAGWFGRAPVDGSSRRRVGAATFAGWHAGRLHRTLRGEHRCLRRAGGRRSSAARLHAGRKIGALLLASRGLHGTLHPTVQRAGDRRLSHEAADPECDQGGHRAGWPDDRVRPAPRSLRAMETLPRRHGVAHPAVRCGHPGGEASAPARGSVQRHRPDVGGGRALLPVGPRR